MITDPVTPGGIVRGDAYAGAEFSPCGRYRFRLWRVFDPMLATAQRLVAWCMLNPSRADHEKLDPTLRRCAGFTAEWGYDGFVVVNLFAWRATDPRELFGGSPIGIGNHDAIRWAANTAELVICGWGSHGAIGLGGYGTTGPVCKTVRDAIGAKAHHLGLTKDGHPRHPLYLRADTKPQPWGPT